MMLVAGDKVVKVLQPTDREFDFPATFDAAQLSSVLQGRLGTIHRMFADQFNLSFGHPKSRKFFYTGFWS